MKNALPRHFHHAAGKGHPQDDPEAGNDHDNVAGGHLGPERRIQEICGIITDADDQVEYRETQE